MKYSENTLGLDGNIELPVVGGDTLEQEEVGTTQLPDELDELLGDDEEVDTDFDPEEDLDDDDSSLDDEEC